METPPHAANSQEMTSAVTSLCPVECVDDVRDEAQMILAVLNGHRSVFAELVRPYESVLYHIALGTLRNQADAEDVTQETLLRAFHKLPGFRSEARFSTWLITIAMNEARGLLRRRKVRGVTAAESWCTKRHSLWSCWFVTNVRARTIGWRERSWGRSCESQSRSSRRPTEQFCNCVFLMSRASGLLRKPLSGVKER